MIRSAFIVMALILIPSVSRSPFAAVFCLFRQFGYDVCLKILRFGYRRKALNGLAVLGNEELGKVPQDVALLFYTLAYTLEH